MCCIRVAVQKQLRQRVDEVVCSPGGMDTRQRAGIEKEVVKQRMWANTKVEYKCGKRSRELTLCVNKQLPVVTGLPVVCGSCAPRV